MMGQRYRLVRFIGKGAMGAVYEAEHVALGQHVALKTLHFELARDPEQRERFIREGRAAARIRHPNVIAVTDVDENDGTPFLVMELLEGEGLNDKLKREGRLGVQESVAILLPVIAAVDAAHRAGVVHRDLKPSNIFLHRHLGDEEPKVLDFGISKFVATEESLGLTGTSQTLGTPYYMSPEQITAPRAVDHRADQYALGAMLYLMVTGSRPYSGSNTYELMNAIVHGVHARPTELDPTIDPGLEAVIETALATRPERRFVDVLSFGAALLPFADVTTRALWSRRLGISQNEVSAMAVALPEARESSARDPAVTSAVSSSEAAGTLTASAMAASWASGPAVQRDARSGRLFSAVLGVVGLLTVGVGVLAFGRARSTIASTRSASTATSVHAATPAVHSAPRAAPSPAGGVMHVASVLRTEADASAVPTVPVVPAPVAQRLNAPAAVESPGSPGSPGAVAVTPVAPTTTALREREAATAVVRQQQSRRARQHGRSRHGLGATATVPVELQSPTVVRPAAPRATGGTSMPIL